MRVNRSGFLVYLAAALALFFTTLTPAIAAPVTTTPSGPVRDQGTGIVLPMTLGGMQLVAVTDYQSPGLGISYRYRDPADPFNLDLYIYNKNQTIPTGIDASIVKQEIDLALNDVRRVAEQGLYKDLKVFDRPEHCKYGTIVFRCVAMAFQINGRQMISMLMVRGERGNFIKVRATFAYEDNQAPLGTDRFMRAFTAMLQP